LWENYTRLLELSRGERISTFIVLGDGQSAVQTDEIAIMNISCAFVSEFGLAIRSQ